MGIDDWLEAAYEDRTHLDDNELDDTDDVRCDECGIEVSGNDGVTDDVGVWCGAFYGNGCAEERIRKGLL